MEHIPDEQLLLNIRDGLGPALDELYRRYAKKLYVFINRVSNLPDPEDAVQDVFIRIIKKAASFDPAKASFQTWVFPHRPQFLHRSPPAQKGFDDGPDRGRQPGIQTSFP